MEERGAFACESGWEGPCFWDCLICGAYGKAWACTSMAGSRDSWEWGKGIWCLVCLNMTGFKQESDFFSQDVTDFCFDVLQFFSSFFHLPHVALFFSLLSSSRPHLSLSTFCFFISFPSSLQNKWKPTHSGISMEIKHLLFFLEKSWPLFNQQRSPVP